jgi:hypothetical protein
VCGALRIAEKLEFGTDNTYIKDTGSAIEFAVSGNKALTAESSGGILHGSWQMDSVAVFSDRRLKKDILPLQRTLRAVLATRESEPEAAEETGRNSATVERPKDGDGALWLLRQLRPVSYSFRKGVESK